MTNAQKIIDWLTEHPNSLLSEIQKGTNLPWMFAGSYLSYLTKNGTLVCTGKKSRFRYRVAEQSNRSNGAHEAQVERNYVTVICPHCGKEAARLFASGGTPCQTDRTSAADDRATARR